VLTRKSAQQVFYRLADEMVVDLLNILRQVAERNLAEIDRLINTYLTVRDDLEPMTATELLKKAKNRDVTVLDVRPVEEYVEGHLPNAINIPLAELEKKLNLLPDGMDTVAYCRGPHCILAFEAVSRLRKNGFNALRFEAGFPEWKRLGLPIESKEQSSIPIPHLSTDSSSVKPICPNSSSCKYRFALPHRSNSLAITREWAKVVWDLGWSFFKTCFRKNQ
jgi:rhodanese-related sulfurtransferase